MSNNTTSRVGKALLLPVAFAGGMLAGQPKEQRPTIPEVVVELDPGGYTYEYQRTIQLLSERRWKVRIADTCASSCTLLTSLPDDRLCVARSAVLMFHKGLHGGGDILFARYPKKLQDWIVSKGGLRDDWLYLRGAELTALFQVCSRMRA